MIGVILNKKNKKIINKIGDSKLNFNDITTKETLIIDATYTEPFYHINEYLIENYTEKIIKQINKLIENKKIKECFIAVTSSNPKLEETIITKTDKYKNINILKTPNLYPINLDKNLIRYIKHKDKVENITVIELKNIINIDDYLLTVYYDNIYDIKVKRNTKIIDILKELNIESNKNIYINGPLRGKIVNINTIIDENIDCIYIEDKNNLKEEKCIKCGKCMNNCPIKLNPTILNKTLKEKCIKCGICNFICPSYINLKERIEKINDK